MNERTKEFLARREQLWARPGPSGPGRRRDYAALVDEWLAGLLADAAADEPVSLVGVGGTGRGDLAPGSDLDLVLLYEPGTTGGRPPQEVADRLWYPIWDSGLRLDHSVRTIDQALAVARDDLPAAVGLLDARHIAGRVGLSARLREQALAGWRASAPHRLAELQTDARERAERAGELAYLLEPDLKESFGGIREGVALRALAASWLVDVPRAGVQEATALLLDVRDALHVVTGRASDRLQLQDHAAVAARAGYDSATDLLRATSAAGRTIAHAADIGWYRAQRVTARPSRRGLLRRRGTPEAAAEVIAEGVVVHDGEVTLAPGADVVDPSIGLRAAAAAAQRGLRLSPSSIERVRAAAGAAPHPWPAAMQEALTTLLGAGRSALPSWEALDQAGLWDRWLPGWQRLRGLPQRNPVHRFTVDRHLVEAAIQAASLTRRVARPDLLLIGALLHDVGKGLPGDHSSVGVPVVEEWAGRIGLPPNDVAVVADLCRYHLLLPDLATRRDPDDPATVDVVLAVLERDGVGLRGSEGLDLLHALTEADARATGPLAWTEWRARLINELVARVAHQLDHRTSGERVPFVARAADHPLAGTDGLAVAIDAGESPSMLLVSVAADDQPGLLAAVAGVLSMNRLGVRAATVQTEGMRALQTWRVHADPNDAPSIAVIREDVRAALEGSLDLCNRLRAREASARRSPIPVPAPRVELVPHASREATVIEVRAHDGPALLFRVASSIAATGVSVRSAHVATLGAEAVDVFYLCDEDGGPLPAALADRVATTLRSALAESWQ